MAKPWYIYTRVSTDDQAREGVSLEAQQAACRAMATALNLPVGRTLVDAGESGKNLARPGMAEVLAAVDAQVIAGVLIYKLDRLTRSLRDLLDLIERFRQANVALHSVQDKLDTSSPNGRFFVSMLGAIAQWERETIAERVTMGKRFRSAQGGFTGGRPPAGLVAVGEPGKRVLQVDPKNGEAVRAIWGMVAAGASLRTCAEHLTAAGVPTSHGARWTPAGTRTLLLNPRVVGHLVDQAAQDVARAALRSRFSPTHPAGLSGSAIRSSDRVWLLAGIAACPQCGARLSGVTATNGSGKSFPYLRCSKRQRYGRQACDFKDTRAEPWERAVCTAAVLSIGAQGGLVPALLDHASRQRQAAGPLAEKLRDLVMERDRIGAELANLGDLAAQGGAIAKGLARTITERQERHDAATLAVAHAEGALHAASMSAEEAETLGDLFKNRIALLPELPPDEQARLLRDVLDEAVFIAPKTKEEAGSVRLSLHLPRLFVHTSSMVEHGTRQTNRVQWVQRI